MNYVGHQSLMPQQPRDVNSIAASETTFRPPGDNGGNGWDEETRPSDSVFETPVARRPDETPRISITELQRMGKNSSSTNRVFLKVCLGVNAIVILLACCWIILLFVAALNL